MRTMVESGSRAAALPVAAMFPDRVARLLIRLLIWGLGAALMIVAAAGATTVHAAKTPADSGASNPDPQEALALVQRTSERVIALLEARREELEASPERLYDLVERELVPYFDFVRISRLVLGKYWRRATPEQRRRFATEFKQMLIRSYASSMLQYTGEKIAFLPVRPGRRPEEVTVRTEVELAGTEPVIVEYSLHWRKGRWLVYDVRIDGVSLVVNFRTTFAEEIRRRGLEALIEQLRERNRQNLSPAEQTHG